MRKNKWSIKWQLFGYLVTFVAGLLLILWLFQVVFMEEFYKRIKIKEVKDVGQKIEMSMDRDYFVDLLDNLASRKQLCIVLTNEDGEGLQTVRARLRAIKKQHRIDFTIINGENASLT